MAVSDRRPSDVPNPIFSSPGFRAFYTLISWGAIGFTLSPGNGMFVGLLILSVGLLVDYLKFTPVSKFRKFTRKIGFSLSLMLMVGSIVALWGAATLVYDIDLPVGAENKVTPINYEFAKANLNTSNLYLLVSESSPFWIKSDVPARWFWAFTGICAFWTILDRASEKREIEKLLVEVVTSGAQVAASEQQVR